MRKKEKTKKDRNKAFGDFLKSVGTFIVLVCVATAVFVVSYNAYTDNVLYSERLSQMKEVTGQLFDGLEDVVDTQWYNAGIQNTRLSKENPSDMDGLVSFLTSQSEISNLSELKAELVVTTSNDRYITESGVHGFLSELDAFPGSPSRISFVTQSTVGETAKMYFLERLDTPIKVIYEERELELLYCGISREMSELNGYFICDAYEGKNAVYVLNEDGTKLFGGEGAENYLNAYNVYSQLSSASYLHGSSFEDALSTLNQNGTSYSNAVIDGQECYYSLYKMEHSSWILLFIVPSSSVAMNTVNLVNMTARIILIFALALVLLSGFALYWMMRRQQKRAVEATERNNEILEEKNRALLEAQKTAEGAMKSAERANKAKTEFLSNMSHDIRTPMNAIVGITKLMEHDLKNPDKMGLYIHKLQSSSSHLLGLINDVLDMSKIEAAEVRLNEEPVNLAEQVGQIDSILRPQVNERQQQFKITVRKIAHEQLIGDAVRIRQILINLLSNAVKYTPDGGRIELNLSEFSGRDGDHETLQITVKDTGYGMTPEFLQHIFEPFTRAEGSITNKVQGTGLGMAITKNIVDMMGGHIEVQSEVNKGSTFTVSIPLKIDKDSKIELEAKNVLLISEDASLIENAEACFSGADVEFFVAKTKPETEALLKERDMDIILLSGYLQSDKLPGIVSYLHENAKDAMLVFCVEYTEQDEVNDFMKRSGVNGLIARPFFLTNFAKTVNQVHNEISAEELAKISSLKGKRFLCAEDNALNAEVLAALLDMNGASCKIYANGKEIVDAFNGVKEGEYDAILMDVQMPVMNGLDATRAIRSGINPLGKTIPIIAMTANAFSSDVQECLDAGMNAHLAKPLEISNLIRTLKTLTSK